MKLTRRDMAGIALWLLVLCGCEPQRNPLEPPPPSDDPIDRQIART